MKLFFIDHHISKLANENPQILDNTKAALLSNDFVEEVNTPYTADAIIINEKNSFKNFNYTNELLKEPLICSYANKVFTINTDDCATGLLRGLYTSIPRSRFNPNLHVSVPYMEYPNELVFTNTDNVDPLYLAGWRGNTKSNPLRIKMINSLQLKPNILLQKTDSWLNHDDNEKEGYVNLIKNSKFSLCPAGWAPVSFRIYESMALGRCPIILADSFVPPYGPNWYEFALFFQENKIHDLYTFLLKHEESYNRLGKNALEAWKRFFSPGSINHYYSLSLISLIRFTPNRSIEDELKRWISLDLRWSNKWTMPQRVVNKVKRIVHDRAGGLTVNKLWHGR